MDDARGIIVTTPLMIDFDEMPKIKAVGCCDICTVLVDVFGGVWSFGGCEYGELGLGYTNYETSTPEIISDIPPIREVFCGQYQTILIDFNGNVWACGNRRAVGLKLGKNNDISASIPEQVTELPPILYASSGFENTIYLDYNYHIWLVGYNIKGQLGLADNQTIFHPQQLSQEVFTGVLVGETHVILVDNSGFVFSAGDNTQGQRAHQALAD